MNYQRKDKFSAYVFLAPWIVTFLVFWFYPLLYSAYMSLTNYKTLSNKAVFIGFENYEKMLSDSLFWKALGNTFIFTFGTVPATTALALFLAVALSSLNPRVQSIFRSSFFAPSITSLVALALIFTNLYGRDGYINSLFAMLNIPSPDKGWLLEPSTALLSIMAMDVWISAGYYMVLFLAGMQTISKDLYDEAKLAGAGAIRTFFSITLPLLKPTLLFVLVINTIKSFQVFVEIYVMTKGGPLNSTTTLVYMVYENAFKKSNMMGYASAVAYALFAILIVFSLIQYKVLKEKR